MMHFRLTNMLVDDYFKTSISGFVWIEIQRFHFRYRSRIFLKEI